MEVFVNDEVARSFSCTNKEVFDKYWHSEIAKDKITGQDLVVSISSDSLDIKDFIEGVLYNLITIYESVDREEGEIDNLWSNITFNWRPIDNPGSFKYFYPFFNLVNIHDFLLEDYGVSVLDKLKAKYKTDTFKNTDFEIFKKLFTPEFYDRLRTLPAIFGDNKLLLLAFSFGLAIFEYEGIKITPEMRAKYTGTDYVPSLKYSGESFLNNSITPLETNSSFYLKGLLFSGFDDYKQKINFLGEDATEDKLNTLTSDQILQILELKEIRDIMSPEHKAILDAHKKDKAAAAAAAAEEENDGFGGGGFNKRRKTKKRKTNKRKMNRQRANKRKTNRRKNSKRKLIKKRTNSNKSRN